MDIKTKVYEADDLKVDAGSREVVAVISSDRVDHDKEIMVPKGLQKKNYAGNPVVLVNHDLGRLPIGKTLWIKQVGNQILAKYFVSDKTQDARDVFGLLQDGVLKAHSIGATALEQGPPTDKELKANPHWGEARNIVRKWDLHEFSVCPIGCNADALSLSVAKKYSPGIKAFLPQLFEAQKDCWAWKNREIEETTAAEITESYGVPLEEIKKEFNPKPKYSMSFAELQANLSKMLDKKLNADDILHRLKGRA